MAGVGKLFQWSSRLAATAVAGLWGIAAAAAADLGDACCADLEERVAELEATTARKGNRKVALTLYGQVNTAVMWWDDGQERNAYIVDNDITSTRFGVLGTAKIRPGWTAGYGLEIEFQSAPWNRVDQTDDEGIVGGEIVIRKSYWYVKSDQFGQFGVGRQDTATSNVAEIDVSGSWVISLSSSYPGSNFLIVGGGGERWSDVLVGNFEFNRKDVIRYDTPTFAGFIASASWGEDDLWDVALRYAGEFSGFRMAAGIGYGQNSEDDAEVVTGSASVLHVPSGLFVTGAAGHRQPNNFGSPDTDADYWYLRGGITQKWMPVGATALYAEFSDQKADSNDEGQFWGVGVVQNLDAAAMQLYLAFKRYDADITGFNTKELDLVIGGGYIKF